MLGRTHKAREVVGILAAISIGAMLFAPVGGADEEEGGRWLIDTYGHPFEPYAGIPDEALIGVPSSHVELDGDRPNCLAVGALYDPTNQVDAVVALIGTSLPTGYTNPSKSRSENPEAANTKSKAEVSTFPNGPRSASECQSPRSGTAEGTFGRYHSDQLSVESATTQSSTIQSKTEDLIVSESVNKIQGLHAGDLTIGSVLTWIKVDWRPSVEPKVTYRVEIAGINDGKGFSGAGDDGIVMSGKNVAGSDFVKQFNTQVKGGQAAFAAIGRYGLRVAEARAGRSQTGRYVFEFSVFDGNFGLAARTDQIGTLQGMRVGVSRAAGRYQNADGDPAPSAGYAYLDDPELARK